jgi:hypothetical protein
MLILYRTEKPKQKCPEMEITPSKDRAMHEGDNEMA